VSQAVARKLNAIKERGGISAREVAQLLGTTPQTVSRWQTGKASPQPRKLEALLILEWLADQLGQFYDPTSARLWLFSHHQQLGGERPADRIAAGRYDDVLALLDQLQSASYT
jgi:transcriptional regulator with XRE-family HTH domain